MRFPQMITDFDLRFYKVLKKKPLSLRGERWLKRYARLGDGWFWGAVLLWLLWSHSLQELRQVLLPALSSALVSLLIYWGVKLTTRRLRPFELWGEEAAVPPLDRYSFPSGHTMNNLAVAMALSFFFPSIAGLAIAVPLSWGILRVYFGVHYLSDIIAGALLALPSAYLGIKVVQLVGGY